MSATTHDQIIAYRQTGTWRDLERLALSIIEDVRAHTGLDFRPKLGGGTRLMLALNHRISHDIDLFIRDPQWLGHVSPRLNDRVMAITPDYEEASNFIKLRLPSGEIDFIVSGSLLGLPDESDPDTSLPLEPVAEVLAKKLFYRGAALAPRDLFDWWAVGALLPSRVPGTAFGQLLVAKHAGIRNALGYLSRSSGAAAMWDSIQAPNKPLLGDAARWAGTMLDQYLRAVPKPPQAPCP